MHSRKIIISLLIAFTGCTVGPKYEPPSVVLPGDWQTPKTADMQQCSADCFQWWRALNDPMLITLLENASNQNLDISIACARILEARAELSGGAPFQYPHVDATAACGHAEVNKKLLNNLIGNHCYKSGRKKINYFECGFDAEWEIDLFGYNEHEINTLKAHIQATEYELKSLWVSLSAEIARTYIELRGAQLKKELLEKNIASLKDTLELIDSLATTGFAGTIDRKQAEQQLYNYQAQEPLVELSIRKSIHKLSILLGYPPGELYPILTNKITLPIIPAEKPIGIPSELLRRRPDILKAERDLAAATEQVGSAVAALFPRLSLTGFVGELATMATGSFAWYAGPSIVMPIFNSKMLEKDVKINKLKVKQAFYQYNKVILEALEETENAIAAFSAEQQRRGFLTEAQKASSEGYQLTEDLYQQGLKNYLQVQESNQLLISAEENLLDSQAALFLSYIALYKSLGGGWDYIECDEK